MKLKQFEVVTEVLGANARVAAELRHRFAHANVLVMNLISSPGSGKTLLLEKTIPRLREKGVRVGVIAADITTSADAERLASHGIPVIQIMTDHFGGACHLEAHVVRQALENFDMSGLDMIFIENVGNLVCPAEFDIGEALRITMLSTTEGEDKPLKYPLSFRVAHCCVVSKIDLIPHLHISIDKLRDSIHRINPLAPRFELSAQCGDGMEQWIDWLLVQNENKAALMEHTHAIEEHGHHHSHG